QFYGLENPGFPETPMLFGGLSAEFEGGQPRLYNTAFLTDGEGRVTAHYDKTYLLDANNNINQTKWNVIHNWGSAGAHQIGIEFLIDAYTGGGADGDRNLYLDGLGVW
ncbi:MAG: hypothetical protein KDD47_10040, partial [Acidobacteria bacterium]|nr:hypothetical protein [Acidobacteriota bacterium]